MQRVLVTTDLPSWDLQLRSDPPFGSNHFGSNHFGSRVIDLVGCWVSEHVGESDIVQSTIAPARERSVTAREISECKCVQRLEGTEADAS